MTADNLERYILLVDDDPNDRELARIVFTELGEESCAPAEVQIMSGGQEALDFLTRLAAQPEQLPDVVLLDLNMPQVDGLSVLRSIRQNPATATLPVVMLSTSRERSDVQRSYALGANAYVVKPLDYDRFRHTISSVMNFWAGQNQVNHQLS
ncbi:response regulator [Deinococcus sp. Marseille-Q6407]|uniref:response regulator n=1 Tax=Deinococcus sp. Marseille-Q6407 TaxID=2969223 RepID=UPI0021C22A19|nr:response regulator [Deinococcus sp. Marseille-Q6407]